MEKKFKFRLEKYQKATTALFGYRVYNDTVDEYSPAFSELKRENLLHWLEEVKDDSWKVDGAWGWSDKYQKAFRLQNNTVVDQFDLGSTNPLRYKCICFWGSITRPATNQEILETLKRVWEAKGGKDYEFLLSSYGHLMIESVNSKGKTDFWNHIQIYNNEVDKWFRDPYIKIIPEPKPVTETYLITKEGIEIFGMLIPASEIERINNVIKSL